MVGVTFRTKHNENQPGVPFAKLEIHGNEFKKVIKWGTRRYDAKED